MGWERNISRGDKKRATKFYESGGGAVTLYETMFCAVLLDLFILSRIVDVYFSREEFCTMGISSKARIISVIFRKELKTPFFKNPIQKSLSSITSNK